MQHIDCRSRQARRILRLLAPSAVVAGFLSVAPGAFAGPPSCKSIIKGMLDVELPAGQRSSRMVRLNAGDSVSFLVSGATDTTVRLVSGSGAPQVILTRETGAMATFTAPVAETYVFAIEAGQEGMTSVNVNCAKAGGERGREAATELPLVTIDSAADADKTDRRSSFSVGFAELVALSKENRTPIDRWIADGGRSLFVDTEDAEGGNAGEVTVSLVANAEIGPDDILNVLDRVAQCSSADGGMSDVEVAIAETAILPEDLTFETSPAPATTNRKKARNMGTDVAALAAPPSETWVTFLHPQHVGDEAEGDTAVSVSRPAAIAASDFPPPPMALGAALPFESRAERAEAAAATQ